MSIAKTLTFIGLFSLCWYGDEAHADCAHATYKCAYKNSDGIWTGENTSHPQPTFHYGCHGFPCKSNSGLFENNCKGKAILTGCCGYVQSNHVYTVSGCFLDSPHREMDSRERDGSSFHRLDEDPLERN